MKEQRSVRTTEQTELGNITPKAPFDFRQMLKRPLSRPTKIAVIDEQDLSYTKAVRLDDKYIPVTVKSVGTVDNPELLLWCSKRVSPEDEKRIRAIVSRAFATDLDVDSFYSLLQQDQHWTPLVERLRGLRPIHDTDLFESMVKIIIGQQVNVSFAATLVERLIELGDETVAWKNGQLPVFPSAETVASWSSDALCNLSFSERKAQYVIDFAKAVADGRVDLEELWAYSDTEVHEHLIGLRGVGRWTIECFLLFGMGRKDIMPAADIGVQNALQRLYVLADRPREDQVREMTEVWAPWRSYVTYYLWQSLIV